MKTRCLMLVSSCGRQWNRLGPVDAAGPRNLLIDATPGS